MKSISVPWSNANHQQSVIVCRSIAGNFIACVCEALGSLVCAFKADHLAYLRHLRQIIYTKGIRSGVSIDTFDQYSRSQFIDTLVEFQATLH